MKTDENITTFISTNEIYTLEHRLIREVVGDTVWDTTDDKDRADMLVWVDGISTFAQKVTEYIEKKYWLNEACKEGDNVQISKD